MVVEQNQYMVETALLEGDGVDRAKESSPKLTGYHLLDFQYKPTDPEKEENKKGKRKRKIYVSNHAPTNAHIDIYRERKER